MYVCMYVHFVFGLSGTLVAAHVGIEIPGVLTVRALHSACLLLCTNRERLVTWLRAYVHAGFANPLLRAIVTDQCCAHLQMV